MILAITHTIRILMVTINFVALKGSYVPVLQYSDLSCDLRFATKRGPLGIHEMSNQKNNGTLQPHTLIYNFMVHPLDTENYWDF